MFKYLGMLWTGFKKVRWPFLLFIVSTSVFLVLLFPLNDVGDLITAQVSQASRNQVYFQFDDLNLSVMPPGLKMNNVYVETMQISALKARDVTVRPSISGLIRGKPHGFVEATGILRGNLTLNVSSGAPSSKGTDRAQIDLTAQKISLRDLRSLLGLPFFMQGDVNIQSSALADLTFQEQPEMDLTFSLTRFELPPTNVNTAFGPLTLPELKLKQVDLKGRLSNGAFIIERGEIGKAGDEIQATVKGSIQMSLQNMNGQIVPIFGSYNLDVDLKTQKSFQDKAGIFLSFLQSHQKSPGQYKFKVAAPQFGLPPNISTLR